MSVLVQRQQAPLMRQLVEENERLREENRQLKEALTDTPEQFDPAWKLTPNEGRALAVLVRRKVASREAIVMSLYEARGVEAPAGAYKSTDVVMCRVRQKTGLTIACVWGVGWSLDAEQREELRKRMPAT